MSRATTASWRGHGGRTEGISYYPRALLSRLNLNLFCSDELCSRARSSSMRQPALMSLGRCRHRVIVETKVCSLYREVVVVKRG